MTVEYDLIVIGGSRAGIDAALFAAHLNARVALVEPQIQQTNWLGYGATYAQGLTQVGRVAKQLRAASQFGIYPAMNDSIQQQTPSVELTEVMQWSQAVVSTCAEQTSPAILASLGVDVIAGSGEFCRLPHLGFVANNRRLRARSYLIATGSVPIIPQLEGLQAIGYFTPEDMWQQNCSQKLQGSWVVIGGEATGVELAQTLARLSCNVTLVVGTSHILSKEDPEASGLVQAQLEAEGIRILTESEVTQVRQIDDKKWIQAGNHALEADEILLAIGQQPNIEALNLAGVGVKFNQQGLELNEKLQTTNSRIYACGDVMGGYQFSHLAQYEATIAVKNALFAPIFNVNYHGIPWAICSDPQLVRVGLTEAQARERYGKDVFVVRQYFKSLDKAQILGETTGFCKIVGRQNGEILGAAIVGAEAGELIGIIAFSMRQKLKIKAIADLPHISSTLSEIIHKTAIEWQRQCFRRNQTLSNFLEWFFNLRRSWSS